MYTYVYASGLKSDYYQKLGPLGLHTTTVHTQLNEKPYFVKFDGQQSSVGATRPWALK